MTTVPAPHPGATALHRRAIDYQVYGVDDDLVVVGRLTDSRPWAEDGSAVATVHDMELRVRVRTDDLAIVGATAVMHAFPHTECPGIESAFVVSGGGTLSVKGQADRLLKAGEGYQVPPETPHSLRNGPEASRVVVTFIVEKDKPLSSPAPE